MCKVQFFVCLDHIENHGAPHPQTKYLHRDFLSFLEIEKRVDLEVVIEKGVQKDFPHIAPSHLIVGKEVQGRHGIPLALIKKSCTNTHLALWGRLLAAALEPCRAAST